MNYVDKQFAKVDDYVKGILDGTILANEYVIMAVKRYVSDLERNDLYMDKTKVKRVFGFFGLLNINIKNKYKQFNLLPFQAFIIANIYGFYWKDTKRRRYRYSYLEMARKSGKTVFSAALSLYHLVADGEQDAEVLYLASTKEQAGIALRYAKSIVQNSPEVMDVIDVKQYYIQYKHHHNTGASNGLLKTLASNADKLDGYSPSYVLIDEYHAHVTDDIFKVMKSGILARDNPLINIITTAGFDLSRPCYKYREGAINVLRKEVDADDLFTIIFTLDDGDQFDDPDVWVKSNPSLGAIIQKQDLVSEFNQAKITPSLLNNFLTKNLNLWVSNEANWIEEKVLTQAFDKKINIDDFKGQNCYIGLDLSSTRDLTSAVLMFERDNKFYVFPYFFMANNPAKKIREGGINLGVWIREKHIIECQTKTIDYELLYDHFEAWAQEYTINAVGYDPFNSALIVPQIEALGVECIKVPQTASAFNFPLKFMEKHIYDGTMHIDNPVLKWNFRNVVLYTDGNENIKIMKNKSKDAVDGCVSLAEAMSMWLQINFSGERLAYESYLVDRDTGKEKEEQN